MKKTITLLKGAAAILTASLLFAARCYAQGADPESSFSNYYHGVVEEKIFVHTDKGAYLTGEILWFKLYTADATYNKPLGLSKVAYVDVLDDSQNPVMQAKIALNNGIGSGSFYIPVTLSNGNYKLRAYTSWMKNFSPDYYFEKAVAIVNPLKAPDVATRQKTLPDFDIQFFPEGGNLVNGLNSKVAFKGVGKDGKGFNFSGAVVNQKKDTVARFQSQKFGMGNFSFTPAAGDTYKAVIKINGGSPVSRGLPAANDKGYVMQLKEDGTGKILVSVAGNTGGSDDDVYLFAHNGQATKVAKRATMSNGAARFTIDKSALNDGVTHITIFTGNRTPVCERLYFKQPGQKMTIGAATDQQQYAGRKRVDVALDAKDASGKLLNANLSMSVYRLDDFQTKEAGDIASYFWLSSDLRGNIESADYYLKNNDAEAADNLMLTQGWRRFQWSEVLKNRQSSFAFLPEYNGHLVTGKIFDPQTSKPATDIVAYLGVPGKRVQVFAAKSDTNGRLLFNTKDFYGQGEIVVQTNTTRDTTYRIDILSPFSEQYSKTAYPPVTVSTDMQKTLELHSLGMQVLNIYSNASIKQFFDAGVDSAAFFGKPFKSYKLDDFTRFTTMEEVLREYIREVYVFHPSGKYHIQMISEQGFLDGDPLVMLDGIPIFDINKVIAIDPLKVRKLDVIRDRYFWGPSVSEGIMSYTTYKGDMGGVELDPHAVVVDYEGLQLQRQFYSPVYDNDSRAASRVPDFRNVLYWAPVINTSAQGKKQVSFYTSDQAGQYIGVVQGMASSGEAGSQVFMFDVKK